MEFLVNLWLPILVSAVAVFILSSLIHMFLKYHAGDYSQLPSEDAVMEDLRKYNIPPGDYHVPFCKSMDAMKSPDFQEKFRKGPVALMTVLPNGQMSMTKSLLLWFFYSVIVGVFAAYIADRAVGPSADYLRVFRFVGCTSFMAYSLALLQNSIWYGKRWGATLRSMFDGLLYGLVTAGVFGWLWPR